MVPRLSHKKSKNGCRRCKARRVKCDELHPTCSNCHRHSVRCEYTNKFFIEHTSNAALPLNQLKDANKSPSSHASPSSSFNELYHGGDAFESISDPDRRLLELRLLHHFVSVVCHTFPAGDRRVLADMWKIDAVQLGFEHPFLMNSIFALASLHVLRG